MSADRNLLFGILAVQLDFVSQDELMAGMNAWLLDKAKPLGDILRDLGHLPTGRLELLDALVAEHLKKHGGDAMRSLAALSSVEPVKQALESLADADVQHTLQQVGAGPTGPPPHPGGAPAAAGVRYRILRPHAKGGLGEVYVAEDTELGRQVALKEIQGRYADDAGSRTRFVLEAEITGGLEHPGIVPVYGLGSYADGRPFYAMRFIKGDNLQDAIKRFHDPASVGASARREGPDHVGLTVRRSSDFTSLAFRDLLQRFVDVCNAVAYAHSRGVLHRDLKPGNVMLGKYGETLVVDWGLAKVTGRSDPSTDGDATLVPRSGKDSSSATVAGQTLGTPAYMSPEQADGRLAELGPATDVYSLGATLYEVLTGRVAFAGQTLTEVLDAVKAGHFPPPRAVRPPVPAALAAVCLKAMALRPAERYASALDVAREVERWLADEPVTAYPEPAGVRLRRWVRRHARLVTAVAAALAVGLAAMGVVAWQREQARRAVAVEQAETAKERDVAREQKKRTRAALDTMISKEMVERLGTQKELTAGQRAFLQTALAYYKEFAAEAATEEVGRKLEADAHFRVGSLLQSLGQLPEAEAAYRAALAVQERLAADHPAVPDYRSELARSHNNLGNLLRDLGKRPEAEAANRAALAVQERLAADHPAVPDYRSELARSHNNLGNLLRDLGKRPEAEAANRAALAVQERLAADHPAVPDYRSDLARSHNNLAILLADLGKRPEAEAANRAALAVQERLAADHPAVPDYRRDLAGSHNNLGLLLADLGKRPEAEAAYRAALALREKLAADHPDVPAHRQELDETLLALSGLSIRSGKVAEAVATAGRIAGGPAPSAETLYDCACVFALASAAANNPDADAHAARAVELLRQAVATGYRDVPHMLKDSDFDPLRRRDDFAALLWDLADGLPPAK